MATTLFDDVLFDDCLFDGDAFRQFAVVVLDLIVSPLGVTTSLSVVSPIGQTTTLECL